MRGDPVEPEGSRSELKGGARNLAMQTLQTHLGPKYKVQPRGDYSIAIVGVGPGTGRYGAGLWNVRITSDAVRFEGHESMEKMNISGCSRETALKAVVHLILSGWR